MRATRFAPLLALAACTVDQDFNRFNDPPVVAITAPEAGAVLHQGAPVPFAGLVEDDLDGPDGLVVTWRVDDGEPLPVDVADDGSVVMDLDVDALSLGEHTIHLSATDSTGDEAVASGVWAVAGPLHAPLAFITSPVPDSLFVPGEEVTLRGVGTDEGGDVDALRFSWLSSIDGELTGALSGGGESALFVTGLSEGVHTIVLTVTDPDGLQGSDHVTLTVATPEEIPVEPGDLVFSEMLINPQVVADEVGEWVELYNTSSVPIDVGGYSFHDLDLDLYVIEGPLVVAGHDYIVLCADMDTRRNGGVPCDGPFKREPADALALGNNSDEVMLSRPDGVVIDQVLYTQDWFTPGVATGLDPRYLETADNDRAERWCDQVTVMTSGGEPGTPGRDNDPCF